MERLPARAPPQPGESLSSLLRRMAHAMGYDTIGRILKLVSEVGHAPFWWNELCDSQVIRRMSELFAMSEESVRELTIHRYSQTLVLRASEEPSQPGCDAKTRLRFMMPSVRICPICIGRDNPIEKLVWSFRPLPICLEHRLALTTHCQKCGKRISASRLKNEQCQCGNPLFTSDVESLDNGIIDILEPVEAALEKGTSLIGDMQPAAGLYWLERIAQAVKKCPAWSDRCCDVVPLPPVISEDDRCWMIAAYTLQDWPRRFLEFLDVYIDEPKYKFTSTGVSRRFGRLLRDAGQLEQLGSPIFADVLRTYLTHQYTAGHVTRKICLFQSDGQQGELRGRDWMTQTSAAQQLQVSVATVRKYVEHGHLKGKIHPAGQRGRTIGVVSKDSVERLQRELMTAVSPVVAARRLGVDRHRVLELIDKGLLLRAVRTQRGWSIPADSVNTLVALIEGLPRVGSQPAGWISVREASRKHGRSGLGYVEIIRLLQLGHVSAKRLTTRSGFGAVILKQQHLAAQLPSIRDHLHDREGIPLQRLAQILFPGRPTKERVLKKLINMGLLAANRTSCGQRVASSEVARFQRTYCLANEACAIIERSRSTLARWETSGVLIPVYGNRVTPGAGFSIYRREDVQQIKVSTEVTDATDNEHGVNQ